jgi:hypothetical protein
MSVGPLGGVFGSAAGTPQARGSEAERAQRDVAAHERLVQADLQAERAAGIGQTEQDEETSERDADGRRPWEIKQQIAIGDPDTSSETPRQSKDPTGAAGTKLDLVG